MKKLRFVVLFLCIAITTAKAQSTFRINYDVALFDLPVNATEALTPGNYIFSGYHANFIPFVSSLTEIDGNGTVLWAKRYSGGLAYMFGDFKRDNTLNRYYACGGADSGPAFLLFIDASGNVVSGRNFSISQADGAFFNKVIKTSDGGYVCVGYVTGYDPDGGGPEVKFSSVTNNDASCSQSSTEVISSPLIVKFDASGNHLWHHVFRYYVSTATPANRIYNDASFVDVVEVSDGYIAVGNYDVNNVFSTFNSDCEDTTPTDALFLKTSTAGAITWHRQIDSPSNSTSQASKSLSSISKTAAGLPLISGVDNAGGTTRPCILMRLPGSGAWANPTWIRRYGGGLMIPLVGPYYPLLPNRFFETSDGNYAVWANYLPFPAFSNLLFKINPSNNSVIWARQHTFNFASIFPYGEQVSDGGYIGVSYTLAGTGHDMHFIKTDVNGNAPSTCAASNPSLSSDGPSYTYGNPIYNSWNTNTVTNNAVTPTVTNITPGTSVQCIQTVCTPPSAPTTVTATPNPICAGQSTTITASGGGAGNTYNVFANATGGTALGATPYTVSPTSTTTYYVETVLGSDPTCVSTTRTPVTVTVNTAPTVTVGSNSPVCVGSTITLNATGGGTYSWTGPNGFTNGTQNPSIPNATTAMSGWYVVTVTTGGCSTTDSVNVTVTTGLTPSVSITANPSGAICAGTSVTFTATPTNGGTSPSYQWQVNGGNVGTNSPTFTSSTLNNGDQVTVVMTSNATCLATTTATSNTITMTVTANVTPSVSITANPSGSVCVGTNITFTATPTNGGTSPSYQWQVNGGNVGTNSPTFSSSTLNNGDQVTVIMTSNEPCVTTATATSNSITISIVTAITPTVTITANPNGAICAGTSVTFTATPTGGGTSPTYQWQVNGSNTGTGATFTSSTLNNGDVVSVTLTSSETCVTTATATDQITITVNPNPTPVITGDTVICIGESTVLTSSAANSYDWSNGGATQAITVSPTATTTYTVTVTDANGCSGSASANVIVNPNPVINISGATNICDGQSTTLTATGGGSYVWSNGGSTAAITVSPSVPTTYIVVVTNNNGCTDSASVNVNVFQQPTAQITGNANMCSGQEYTLTATGGTIYAWSTGDSTSVITVSTTVDTMFVVNVSNGACSDSDTIYVTALSIPVANAGTDITINQIQTATLTATGGGSYLWTPSAGLDCDTCATVNAKPEETTTYCVTVTDANVCRDSACVIVTVDFICGEIFVPTIFSPNGDGNNDNMCVLGNCVQTMTFTIYSRWGEKVFETTDPKICWDGTYKGQIMNTGSFVYVLEAILTDGTTVQEKGNFTLVR
jgi:gliding motility-associated-like protein